MMRSSRTSRAVALLTVAVLAAGAVALAGGPRAVAGGSRAAGSPDAGQSLFFALGCGGCHALDPAATSPSVGPVLTRDALAARAQAVGKPLGPFVAESIVSPSADPDPGWVSTVMRPFAELKPSQLDDLVSFLIGAPYTGSGPAGAPVPRDPVRACNARASCRATVARWTRQARLPAAAVPGAKVFATVGCLSCHSYAGAGVRGVAPDLTRAGVRARPTAARLRWLRCARCVEPDAKMPSFASLGDANLRRLATFLSASKGVR